MALERSHTLAELLRAHRHAADLTQEELAERARVSVRALRNLESGDSRVPRRETLVMLADALALTGANRDAFLASARQTNPPATRPGAPGRESVAHPTIPLVGRSRELARLGRALESDTRGGVAALMIDGEPGLGKSRLLQEVERRARVGGWTVLAAGCHRRSGPEPYAPFAGLLAHFLAARPLAQRRRDLAGCGWLVRLLPELLESGVAPAPAWKLPPEQERRLMFAAVRRFLHNVASPSGTLLLLDDLQWAGADALDLLVCLLREPAPLERPETSPLRVIGAYRHTDVAPGDALPLAMADLMGEGMVEQLTLGPLAWSEQEELLGRLLGGDAADPAESESSGVEAARRDHRRRGSAGEGGGTRASSAPQLDMPEELRQQVLRRTDGIPFFLVSFVQSLLSGAGHAAAEHVPAGIRQSIRQRLLTLPPQARELLGVVAVAGRQMPRRHLLLVAAQLGRDSHTLLAALDAACQAALLTDDSSREISFTHDLIRDVVLEDLTPSRRAAWHLALAEALQRLADAERERQSASLALHFAEAGEHARALPYMLRAGDRAEASYAHAEAEQYYRRALELARSVEDGPRAAEAEEKLGAVLAIVARYTEALEMLEAARAGYAGLGHVDAQARVVAQLGTVYSSFGAAPEGIERLQREVVGLEAGAVSASYLAEVLLALALLYRDNGRYEDHLRVVQRAAELASATTDDRLRARTEARLGVGLLMVERNPEGVTILEQALGKLEAVGELRNLSLALNTLAVAHETQEGDFALARRYLMRAVQCAERLGDPTLLAFMISRRGTNAFATGDWQEALGDLEHAVTLSREADGTWPSTYPLINVARLYLARGRRQQAWTYLAPALEVAERNGDIQALRSAYIALAESEILTGRADRARERLDRLVARASSDDLIFATLPVFAMAVLADTGDTTRATALLDRALACAARSQNRAVRANAMRVYGLALTRERRYAEASAALEESVEHARATSDPYGVAKSLYAQAQLHEAQGELAAARERYEAALAICERLGERLYRARIERALAVVVAAK